MGLPLCLMNEFAGRKFPQHAHPDVQAQRNTSRVKTGLKVVKPGWKPFSGDESSAIVSEESAVGRHRTAVVPPRDKSMNHRPPGSRPDPVQTRTAMPRVLMIDRPNAELDLLFHQMLAESGGHSYAERIPTLAPFIGIISELIESCPQRDTRHFVGFHRANQREMIFLLDRERGAWLHRHTALCFRCLRRPRVCRRGLSAQACAAQQSAGGEFDNRTHRMVDSSRSISLQGLRKLLAFWQSNAALPRLGENRLDDPRKFQVGRRSWPEMKSIGKKKVHSQRALAVE